jgi:hypothetical protein
MKRRQPFGDRTKTEPLLADVGQVDIHGGNRGDHPWHTDISTKRKAIMAADYTVWRDGDSPDSTTAGYNLWVDNFGQSSASGSGADHVPEPTTLLLALLALVAVPLRVRHG